MKFENTRDTLKSRSRGSMLEKHSGMTKTEYNSYLSSERWKSLRKEVFEDKGGKCIKCSMPRWLASIAYNQDVNIHHETYENLGTDNEIFDLQPLCRKCHEIETFGRSELKSPKSATCDVCNKTHWNPWSGKCELCFQLTEGLGWEGLSPYIDLVDKSYGESSTVDLAESMLYSIFFNNGIDYILNLLVTFDGYGKEVDSNDEVVEVCS